MNKVKFKIISFSLVTVVIIFSLFIYLIYKSTNLKNYDKLNSCLRASVSKLILCSKSDSYVVLDDISQNVIQAIITSEDDKFYFHKGFDWKEFRASVAANLRAFSFVRGGSTITQQLVKNIYLSQEKSIIRKVKEALIASQIEDQYSKSLILEKYLNAIEFGPDIWGIKKASKYYFSKEPKNLEVLEGAYLAVLLPSPKRYSQSFTEKKLTPYLKRRIKTILQRLKWKKVLDEVEYSIALENIDHFPWDKAPALDIELYDFEADTETMEESYNELADEVAKSMGENQEEPVEQFNQEEQVNLNETEAPQIDVQKDSMKQQDINSEDSELEIPKD
jgi:monofunctional biosynthetic peptidoglycan transglycosylase